MVEGFAQIVGRSRERSDFTIEGFQFGILCRDRGVQFLAVAEPSFQALHISHASPDEVRNDFLLPAILQQSSALLRLATTTSYVQGCDAGNGKFELSIGFNI